MDDTVLRKKKNFGFPLNDLAAWQKKLLLLSADGVYGIDGERIFRIDDGERFIEAGGNLFVVGKRSLSAVDGSFKIRFKEPVVAVKSRKNFLALLCIGAFYVINSKTLKVVRGNTAGLRINSNLSLTDRTLIDIEEKRSLAVYLYSSSPKSRVVLFDFARKRKLWEKDFDKKSIAAVGFWRGKAFVVQTWRTIYGENTSKLYLLSISDGTILESIPVDYFVTRAFSTQDLLILTGELGLFEVFFKNLQNRHSLSFPSENVIIDRLLVKDVDVNGEEDILCTGFSNFPHREHRWKGASLLKWSLSEARQKMLENIRMARKLNKKFEIWAALNHCEAAMEVAQFLEPELMPELLELHSSIMKKLRFWLFVKQNYPKVILALIFIALVLTTFWLYRRLKMSGNPPDWVLTDLSGSNFSHQIMHLLKGLVEAKEEDFKRKFKESRAQIAQLYNYFLSFQFYFSSASPEWWFLFKKVKKHLGRLLRTLPDREKVKGAYEAVKEFAFKLRSMRGSVIEHALKPAINAILPIALEKGVKVELDLQPSSGIFGYFYPEKLHEFRNAFYAILQNAIEAFEGFVPQEGPVVSISAEESFYNVLIIISDNGKGMDERTKALMFSPGFSTKRVEGGYGLAGIDKLFKEWGDIEVISSPGQGTTIKITMELKK